MNQVLVVPSYLCASRHGDFLLLFSLIRMVAYNLDILDSLAFIDT